MPLAATAGSFRRLARCHGHKFATFCTLFDRTSRRLLTGSDDYLIKVWCTQTGYLINTFKGHREVVTDMALNVEGTLLASSSTDGTVRIWNLKTGEPRGVLVAHPGGRAKAVTDVTFSPAPHPEIRYLATLCDDGLCRLYRWDRERLTVDPAPIELDPRTQSRDRVSSFAFNHTGSRLALATASGFVSVYSTIAGATDEGGGRWGPPKLIARVAAHESSINTLVFSRDGDMFLTGSTDGTAKAWACRGADRRWESVTVDAKELPPDAQSAPPLALFYQQQQPQPASVATSDAAAPPMPGPPPDAQPAQGPALPQPRPSRRGSLARDVSRAADTALETRPDAGAAAPEAAPAGVLRHAGEVELVADTSASLAGGAAEPAGSAAGGDAPSNRPAAPKRVETNQVAWTCDGSRVLVSNNVGSVAAFDPRTGKECWRRRAHSVVEVYVLIPHPTDPRIAVSGGYDGRAVIWDVSTGDILKELKVGEQLFDGSFSRNGLMFALTSESGAATLFGLGPAWAYDAASKMAEQMFDSDYTATIMDENRFVADQQTQIPAYLVPHSALMDFDGRVYRAQKGPRFGMGIEMGLDDCWFAREDAGRMAALCVELDHAYIDRRAAQEPVEDVRPARSRRRRTPRAAADEITEAELLPLIIPIDDSDDEEYNAGLDGEEEDEEEAEDEDDEDAAGNESAAGRMRSSRTAEQAAIDTLDDARDRRSALEILRSRHRSAGTRGQRAGVWRAAHRPDDDTDEDVDIDSMDVDMAGSQTTDGAGRAGTNGRALRSRRQQAATEAPAEGTRRATPGSSDDDFQPHAGGGRQRRHRIRSRGRPRRVSDVQGESDEPSDVQRNRRRRRIASDSEDESVTSGMAQVDIGASGNEHADGDSASGSDFGGTRAGGRPTRHTRQPLRGPDRGIAGLVSDDDDDEDSGRRGRHRRRTGTGGGYRGRIIEFTSASESDGQQAGSSAAENRAATGSRLRTRGGAHVASRSADRASGVEEPATVRGPTRNRAQPLPKTAASTSAGGNGANQYLPTDWLLATQPSTVPYRPQIGDIVVYFREGHADFWSSPARCMKLSEKLVPYVATSSLAVAVYGKVVGLQYSVGPPTFCTVKIQLLLRQSVDELDQEDGEHELTWRHIQVQYHDCDGVPDFLVLYSRYRASLRQPLRTGDPVSVLFGDDQAHRAVISGFRDIKPTSRQTSVTKLIARNPWRSVVVEWVDSDARPEQASPWELVHDEDAADVRIAAEARRRLLAIVGRLRRAADFAWFVANVDYVTEYPNYLLSIAYPMCLDTIYQRLENDYYRHVSAVSFDVALIQENADIFNDPGTLVPLAAQRLVASYHEQLARDPAAADGAEPRAQQSRGEQTASPSRPRRRSSRLETPLKRKLHAESDMSVRRSARLRLDSGSGPPDYASPSSPAEGAASDSYGDSYGDSAGEFDDAGDDDDDDLYA
ncbi:hypothetical protein LPJ61_001323 [Coemansia biformis]|uniref:Bromo domain-containing protein n=1 Tax=Coemansia biformis TaxID=1286918 RepID=A0A9W7YA83_9FUNG|nr:hypothetical protein LPJ61_001323 [Coemansia biformis]